MRKKYAYEMSGPNDSPGIIFRKKR